MPIGKGAAEHADIAAVGSTIVFTWKEFNGQQSTLHAQISNDTGATWRNHELMRTAGASGQPILLQRAGLFHVFWNTRNEPLAVVPVPR
ncbi:MAG: hypothetical protein EXR29_08835 [Betaproteobacteria bacterium]|nr:hypothetical protein [Betaproteobacteria bacterium]